MGAHLFSLKHDDPYNGDILSSVRALMGPFEPVIGLEIHAELKTRAKMFCACLNDPSERHPNVNVCPVCLGHPGTLPVPNREAIRIVQRVGAALHGTLASFSKFDRKNYFYPDLPKGYQISQYDLPLVSGGYLDLLNGRRIRIERIHLEEDTGRLLHPEGAPFSIVDFNRAGVPLMELVTEPDLRSAEDVALFAEELQRILRYLRASDANMEKGEMRVEVNISLRERSRDNAEPSATGGQNAERHGTELMGTKVEVKNLNSIRSARMAVAYEIERQSRLLREGKPVVRETRGWHDTKELTFSQRSKEEAHDYRYFPEPDIPPLTFSQEELEAIRASLPELPAQRRARFIEEYGLSPEETAILIDDESLGTFFEESFSELLERVSAQGGETIARERLSKLTANYLLTDLRGILLEHATNIEELELLTPERFAELLELIARGKVTSRVAKDVLSEMFATGRSAQDIVAEQGLSQVSDEGEIARIVEKVVSENPKPVEDFRKGKEQALQFLVGKVMAATRGKVNPALAQKLLRKALLGR
jgi:aspartyl-tRNA(Asn)/glutamyl-tRNA(Gln) amidotransferase subunit B